MPQNSTHPESLSSIYPLSNSPLPPSGRVALVLGYEGARYHGWQAQNSGVSSVQQTLETALSRVADTSLQVVCAGRTDAGVNATQQVVHFESAPSRSPHSWVMGANHFLPDDIAIQWAGSVCDDFHARYSATSRVYRYVIYNHPVKPAWAHGSITWIHSRLEEHRMHVAAQALLGENDFTSFRGSDCQSHTPFRNVSRISVTRRGELVIVEIEANAFLHHMVRNIVGTLLQVGTGKQSPEWVADVLAAKKRSKAGVTAPANGLYLVKVHYPEQFGLPEIPYGPFFLED
ncbi:tRNA pseudouridine(38-40) synthase TruA [Hahella sp. CCB-MM4]|uniref:tRNA pseudouridine(38-40) synthase TruA n=1 Tax=Hahella sp. (strain CCB-MM4) TaxID=1926491 RepID=UPI000B9B0D64|nr:tRNA pseudouridine(38-40) synthase TruA [Hahella sp. CCB-MM4]OZG73662.1 tRNA pseudouridine(38-40) synthase TruA [Hahella sp. CCB-MM4]